jgi:hypothetical protein
LAAFIASFDFRSGSFFCASVTSYSIGCV